nr:MBL fold metallo-hydrolase [Mycolicibacterium neoaurum]
MGSSYSGTVVTGGPPAVRDLAGLRMTKIAVGDFNNNSYILECTSTGERLLIDAAADSPKLLHHIGSRPLAKILTTHSHRDHWQALADVVAHTGAQTLAHPADASALPVPTDVKVHDSDEVAVGQAVLRVIHIIGHTLGSVALAYREPCGTAHIWTGDCLFPGGVGSSHDTPELFDILFRMVVTKIFDKFGDDTWIYPGHGDDTTLGAERPNLAAWEARGW